MICVKCFSAFRNTVSANKMACHFSALVSYSSTTISTNIPMCVNWQLVFARLHKRSAS
uniref:Uncharacterized protein n=1 Tax=Arundo donax TaxID=35708 RepID=A0A0A9G1Z6_ARUDO